LEFYLAFWGRAGLEIAERYRAYSGHRGGVYLLGTRCSGYDPPTVEKYEY